MSTVTESFGRQGDEAELLPDLLSRACVQVLSLAGAGLSLTEELRVPLGASDAVVADAERLQSTLGEGPCLSATAEEEPLVAGPGRMADQWPVFHLQLVAQTPYRAIASIPLRSPRLPRFGALDLYSTDPDERAFRDLPTIRAAIADPISGMLFEAPTATFQHGIALPTWLNSTSVTERMNVWVAIGMVADAGRLTNADAIATLRAYAFGRGATLDAVARQLTTHRLDAGDVLD